MRLIDTDVCIEILRGNPQVIERRAEVPDEVATSWVSAAELYYGAEKSSAAAHNSLIVTDFLATLRVLGPDRGAAWHFGRWKAELERAGQRLADADLFIAATALSHGAVLVTGNRQHYERIEDLSIEDWLHAS
ncbi:MAG: PIN domain-containing protein [Deltaproteobacteria bacterium]|nr:PIN domain-containing protein [Deltaproteobacteria bacterium]